MIEVLKSPWLLGAALVLLIAVMWRAPRAARWRLLVAGALVAAAVVYLHAPTTLREGAPVTPGLARSLYDQFVGLHEPDGCGVVEFETKGSRIRVGLQSGAGSSDELELSTAVRSDADRRAGAWALSVPPSVPRDCAATLAAIEHVLAGTAAPSQSWTLNLEDWTYNLGDWTYNLLAATFVLLVLGTVHILYRELGQHRPSPYAVLALLVVWAAALALRLELSPRTFLHEYYHIAETIVGYLSGEHAPAYGNTGPALFRLVATVLKRPEDVQVIFVTNAVIASLAIPAVALLTLSLTGSWPQGICAGVLLCVLPQHLRFSAAEDLFVQAVTFGMWTLALFALYLRTRRFEDALLTVLALSLAMQARPEMIFFPAVLVSMALLTQSRSWRVLVAWPTLVGLLLLAVLLVPRFLDLRRALSVPMTPTPALPRPQFYFSSLVLLQSRMTPWIYWVLLLVGLAWGILRRFGVHLWVILVFIGYTVLSLTLGGTPIYHLRTQILPTSFVVVVAAGAASVWMALWGTRRRLALRVGAGALVALAVAVVLTWRGFVTELRDQQHEWMFLERTVSQLPNTATLLSAVTVGGHALDAFPEYLLQRERKDFQLLDVRDLTNGDVAWPAADDNLLYYQGMFCYFAFDDEPSPDPMTGPCRAVHEHYTLEPLFVEDLQSPLYSQLRYANGGQGPFRIGFYRLKPRG